MGIYFLNETVLVTTFSSRSCEYAAPCYPIEVPPNDPRIKNRRCIDFFRSSAICGSGQTSVFFDSVMPREQINQLTSYIDASQVSIFIAALFYPYDLFSIFSLIILSNLFITVILVTYLLPSRLLTVRFFCQYFKIAILRFIYNYKNRFVINYITYLNIWEALYLFHSLISSPNFAFICNFSYLGLLAYYIN